MTAFAPFPGKTQTLSVTATAASTTNAVNPEKDVQRQVVVTSPSSSPNTAFIRFGTSAELTANPASATTDYPILPGTFKALTVPPGAYMSAVCATGGTATLYVAPGYGE